MLDSVESMEEDFTGFEEEPIGVVVNPSGAAILDAEISRLEDPVNETDSDSGNLVIAEPEKKTQAPKSADKSPRKRRSKVEDVTPTRAPSSRVRGQGLAYLLAMEKGGSKKQLAKAQAQVDAKDIAEADAADPPAAPVVPEPKKAPTAVKPAASHETLQERSSSPAATSSSSRTNSPLPPMTIRSTKAGARKSFSAVNISSPLLKEPFNEGKSLSFILLRRLKSFSFLSSRLAT